MTSYSVRMGRHHGGRGSSSYAAQHREAAAQQQQTDVRTVKHTRNKGLSYKTKGETRGK